MDDVTPGLDRLLALPGVQDGVTAARQACTQLRWHPALRRRTAEAAAEARVRAARSSAALDGARLPVELVRDAARGARRLPTDPAGRTVHGALRALSELDRLGEAWQRAPLQALARLHVAAAADLLDEASLGRPRGPGEQPLDGVGILAGPAPEGAALHERLAGLVALLAAPPQAPALLVAALVHAELATVRPFLVANGVVARAMTRAVVVGRGLDPAGVAVWEAAHLAAAPAYATALAGYASGQADGVAGWLRAAAAAMVDGAAEGTAVCDAVVAGRLT